MKKFIILLCFCLSSISPAFSAIDREAVVKRHNITINSTIEKSPTQVGNGRFAFGMDVTGFQTFTSFNTLSDWGWHSFPVPDGVHPEGYKGVELTTHGKTIPYLLSDYSDEAKWLRCNPHRVNLGRIALKLSYKDGRVAMGEAEIKDAVQHVDLWTGIVESRFTFDGVPVKVISSCAPDADLLSFSVTSDLVAEGRLGVEISFPYADGKEFAPYIGGFNSPEAHETTVKTDGNGVIVNHDMGSLVYDASLRWEGGFARVSESGPHSYLLTPSPRMRTFNFTCQFIRKGDIVLKRTTSEVEKSSVEGWRLFWMSGAAADFGECTDPRAPELERRVVLSQYLMRLNEAGLYPPQEAGLVNNGWFGRMHFEMVWWHGAHWGLWNRFEYLGYLDVFNKFMPEAVARAESEGRRGARWPKCTGDINSEWPCEAHALLMWQQPHPIYFAEMEYRAHPTKETVDKWGVIVKKTADYLSDLVFWDELRKRYVLGPPMVVLSENTNYMMTQNPAFELCYTRYALRTALKWAKRMKLGLRETWKWRQVLSKLSDLPTENGFYITYEGMDDMWKNYNWEHPGLTGMYGWLPGDGVDIPTFRRTYYEVLSRWQMAKVWGWDYPMLAMAAARLGDSEKAVDLLTTTAHKFGFDAHGLAQTWPFPYFPANGGLLSAVAMMCAGWGGQEGSVGKAPGFPKDGGWNVLYEGFNVME